MKTQGEYNLWFREMLKSHAPKQEYQIEEHQSEDGDYLVARFSHPDDSNRDIVVATHNRELTLYFWKHHQHHDSFESDDHEQEFVDLCEYIEDIMADKVFFSVTYHGSKPLSVRSSYNLEDHKEKGTTKIEVITWSGKFDQVIED